MLFPCAILQILSKVFMIFKITSVRMPLLGQFSFPLFSSMSGSSSESGGAIIRACTGRGDGVLASRIDLTLNRVEPTMGEAFTSGRADPRSEPLP